MDDDRPMIYAVKSVFVCLDGFVDDRSRRGENPVYRKHNYMMTIV